MSRPAALAEMQSGPRSPSTAPLPLSAKLRASMTLLRSHAAEVRAGGDFEWVFDDISVYERLLRRYAGVALADARVLEIGYGARPFRLIALQSMRVDAEGVDAEAPVLDGRPSELIRALRVNGVERMLKSATRYALFDRRERSAFTRALARRGLEPAFHRPRFHVADAAAFTPSRSYDLIVSEDVFEHIAPASLSVLVPRMASWLAPGGIALIRPNVFTGITGGHALDWTRHSLTEPGRDRTVQPWDHLRSRRHRPNTYLNEFTRADYRQLFSTAFEILEEEVTLPDLGREFLTGAVAEELAAWPDEELFSNQVRMVLRAR